MRLLFLCVLERGMAVFHSKGKLFMEKRTHTRLLEQVA